MAQGRSTEIISMIWWIWTSRLSINFLSLHERSRECETCPHTGLPRDEKTHTHGSERTGQLGSVSMEI